MFKIESFDIKLDTEILGRNFIYCEEAESSNTVLLNDVQFDKEGTVFLVENQTKGRGRLGRMWDTTPDNNLTFSVLLKDSFINQNPNLISLAAGLAVAQSIENLYQLKVDLKWPNDVLIEGKKLCGILCESVSQSNVISKIVVGIGINVNQSTFPSKYNIVPTSIKKETKKIVQRERLLSEVLNNFEIILNVLMVNPKQVLEDWRSRCRMIGEKIKIVDNEKEVFGIFEDIDNDGCLLLKNNDGTERISFGDVSLR